MPKFNYQAIDDTGRLVKGNTIASGDRELEAKLAEKGLTLVSIRGHADRFRNKSLAWRTHPAA